LTALLEVSEDEESGSEGGETDGVSEEVDVGDGGRVGGQFLLPLRQSAGIAGVQYIMTQA
jgi:hypothetical protein